MNEKRCSGCMAEIENSLRECPRCGYVEGTPRALPALEAGTLLAEGRYFCGKKLRQNGEGITYLAFDNKRSKKVLIKEFLPKNLAERTAESDAVKPKASAELGYKDYLEDFLEISRTVSRLSELPSIAPVVDIFECNSTAYCVYEFTPGKKLSAIIKRAGRITWEEAKPLFLPLISSVAAAHAIGLVHFGISPDTLILTKDSRLVIETFGIPDSHLSETDLEAELFPGFSAIEQYAIEGKKGKWTDVYAVCAALFYSLTGRAPKDAVQRGYDPRLNIPSELSGDIPAHVITAMSSGLQVKAEQRTPNMDILKRDLRMDAPPQRQPRIGTPPPHPMNSPMQEVRPVRAAPPPQGFMGKLSAWLAQRTQWQYALLSVVSTVLILGILLLAIWPSVSEAVGGDSGIFSVSGESPISDDTVKAATDELYSLPDFSGKTLEQINADPNAVYFTIYTLEGEYSESAAKDTVVSQNKPAGTEFPNGTPVGIKLSLGSQNRKVPDLAGKTVFNAAVILEQNDLRLGLRTNNGQPYIAEEYSSTVPAGTIIRLDGFTVNQSVPVNSEIFVIVSLGEEFTGKQ